MSTPAKVADPTADEGPQTKTDQNTAEKTGTKPKRQPPYAVVLHNDHLNTATFVVTVLRKVFGYGRTKATVLMLQAHRTGRSIVWTGTLELAELKADQVRSCGPDPITAHRGAQQLTVTLEPLPQD